MTTMTHPQVPPPRFGFAAGISYIDCCLFEVLSKLGSFAYVDLNRCLDFPNYQSFFI